MILVCFFYSLRQRLRLKFQNFVLDVRLFLQPCSSWYLVSLKADILGTLV